MENLVGHLRSLFNLVNNIPPYLWGSILGACFALMGTLVGSYLTNRGNDRRLREQFKHEREVKNREREMVLRKEIYMNAAEAIHAAIMVIPRLSQLEVPYDKLTNEYLSKASAMAKIHIVATEPTIKAVLSFSSELAAILMQLTARRVALNANNNPVDTAKFKEECMKETLRIWRLSVSVVTCARMELDLPLDERAYAEAVEETIQKQMLSMQGYKEPAGAQKEAR